MKPPILTPFHKGKGVWTKRNLKTKSSRPKIFRNLNPAGLPTESVTSEGSGMHSLAQIFAAWQNISHGLIKPMCLETRRGGCAARDTAMDFKVKSHQRSGDDRI
jgi:hypothetical protein